MKRISRDRRLTPDEAAHYDEVRGRLDAELFLTTRVPILTVLEPFASAIILGPKRIENRTWKPPADLIGGDLAIHAGKKKWYLQQAEVMAQVQAHWPELPNSFPSMGCVIGVVRLTGCTRVPEHPDAWAHGPWCWHLENPRRIEPVAVRGRPGIFYHDLSRKEAPCLFSHVERERPS
jgi:hypothetical protein